MSSNSVTGVAVNVAYSRFRTQTLKNPLSCDSNLIILVSRVILRLKEVVTCQSHILSKGYSSLSLCLTMVPSDYTKGSCCS